MIKFNTYEVKPFLELRHRCISNDEYIVVNMDTNIIKKKIAPDKTCTSVYKWD